MIVADDLSGAADTAVAFARDGRRPVVRWRTAHAWLESSDPPEVLALDTETRSGSAQSAAEATTLAVGAARRLDAGILFKKIDSTLRGHVGSEVAAALDAWGTPAMAVVAPAFPEVGRTTRLGCQLVNGTPLPASAIAPRLDAAGLRTQLIDLSEVRSEGLAECLVAHSRAGVRAVVCDADCPDDLVRIARAALSRGREIVWVGSGGLARALAAEQVRDTAAPEAGRLSAALSAAGRPVLIVVGSATTTARQQAQCLADAGATRIAVPLSALREAGPDGRDSEILAVLCDRLAEGTDVVVTIEAGTDSSGDPRIVDALAAWLRPVAALVGGVVVTGGETAVHLFDAWGITGLEVIGEIEPGVPRALSLGRVEMPVVTKAGGFGDAAPLERARRALHEQAVLSRPKESEGVWPVR